MKKNVLYSSTSIYAISNVTLQENIVLASTKNKHKLREVKTIK